MAVRIGRRTTVAIAMAATVLCAVWATGWWIGSVTALSDGEYGWAAYRAVMAVIGTVGLGRIAYYALRREPPARRSTGDMDHA